MYFIQLISDRSDISQADAERIADKLNSVWSKTTSKLAPSSNPVTGFADYLKTATKEQLTGTDFGSQLNSVVSQISGGNNNNSGGNNMNHNQGFNNNMRQNNHNNMGHQNQGGFGGQSNQNQPEVYQVYVGDLDPVVTNHNLLQYFKQIYNSVCEAKVIVDPVSRKSKGYGFIKFQSKEESERALQEMNGKQLYGRAIKMNYASQRTRNQNDNNMNNRYGQQHGGNQMHGG